MDVQQQRRSEGERFEGVKAALHERSLYDDGAGILADMLARCDVDWDRKYRCRSPGCPTCRRANIRREQRVFREMLDGATNADLAFVTVVLPGTRDIDDLTAILRKGVQDARNRVKACRRTSSHWDQLAILGWHEIDAISPEQLALLPPDRRALMAEIAPLDFDQDGPTWVPTFHAVAYLGDVTADELAEALRQQWPLAGQMNVKPFNPQRNVDDNRDRVISYGNKFGCETDLSADIKGGKLVEQWPATWEAEFLTWLHRGRRNAFERLRFAIGPKADPRPRNDPPKAHVPIRAEVEPMPMAFSMMTDLPDFPWINTTGAAQCRRGVYDEGNNRTRAGIGCLPGHDGTPRVRDGRDSRATRLG